jgi:hypothetical protein
MCPKSRNQDETARLRRRACAAPKGCPLYSRQVQMYVYKFHCSNEMRSKFDFLILFAVSFTKITRLSVICHRLSIRQILHRRVQTPNEREVQTSELRATISPSGERTLMRSSPRPSRRSHSDGHLRAATTEETMRQARRHTDRLFRVAPSAPCRSGGSLRPRRRPPLPPPTATSEALLCPHPMASFDSRSVQQLVAHEAEPQNFFRLPTLTGQNSVSFP